MSENNNFEESMYQRLNAVERDVFSLVARFDSLDANISRLAHKADAPTNWVGIGGLVAAAFGVAMTIMSLSTASIADRLENVEGGLAVRTELVYSAPGRIENLENYIDDHRAQTIRLAEKAATHDAKLEWYGEWLSFLETQTDAHKTKLDELTDRVAKNEGSDEVTHHIVEDLNAVSRKSEFIHGQREALEKRVNDIDNLGSRRWNEGPPK